MSTRNQQRRSAKRRRQQQEQFARERAWSSRHGRPSLDGLDLEEAVAKVARAHVESSPLLHPLVAELTAVADADAVTAAAGRVLARLWTRAQTQGWTPELAGHAARRLGRRHTRWLLDGEPADLRCGIELLAWLLTLPALPRVTQARLDAQDARLLAKVRALLAKAESTEFPDEAEALTAKAQQLVSTYSLERVLADHTTGERPGLRRIPVDDPYADAKMLLLDVVAKANRSRSVMDSTYGFSTVLGFETDLQATEMLFASLLVQVTRAMTSAAARGGSSRQASYRRSFLVSFAHRIGERLAASTASAAESVARDERLLPVLASRSSAVDDAVDEVFPRLTTKRLGVTNQWGWAAGRAAADLADLSAGPALRAG